MHSPSHLLIGGHRVEGAALLAPMSGVTDHGFRRIAQDFGASLVVSEMVAADQLAFGAAEAFLRAEGAGIALHVVQLAGCTAKAMAEGAKVAEASGAAIIDINMGCPAKKVVNGWAGSALMRDLDHAQSLIEAVRAAVSIPVTLKMRLGWDDASRNAGELARRAEGAGLSMLTVHGRTRAQFYKGKADWRAVAGVKAATTLPLIVNGDITSLAEARAALAQSGADGVMIGRAALGRPWLVGEITCGLAGKPAALPTKTMMISAIRLHYESLIAAFGAAQGVRHARKHVAAYLEEAVRLGASDVAATREKAVTSDAPGEVLALLEAAFSSIPDVSGVIPDAA